MAASDYGFGDSEESSDFFSFSGNSLTIGLFSSTLTLDGLLLTSMLFPTEFNDSSFYFFIPISTAPNVPKLAFEFSFSKMASSFWNGKMSHTAPYFRLVLLAPNVEISCVS